MLTLAGAAIAAEPSTGNEASGVQAQRSGRGLFDRSLASVSRAGRSFNMRQQAADANRLRTPKNIAHPVNFDDELYPNKIASFTKALPHYENGEVDPAAYSLLTNALTSGSQQDFNLIPLGGTRRFTSPQSGYAFDMQGGDAQCFVMPPPPLFASRETAAEIAENYWMAVMRDVAFTEYGASEIAEAACADLNAFGSSYRGAKTDTGGGRNNGIVTPETLFRGLTAGDKAGPYMSQFWYQSCRFGANLIDQRIRTVRGANDGGRDYMTDFGTWLNVQRGHVQERDVYDPIPRYMRNARDLGEWVHVDVLFQGYFQAFLVLGALGAPVDDGNPYKQSANQIGFATFGGPHIATLLCEVATRALKAVWFQKWMVHRRLRPEAFAGRIDRTLYGGANYPVHTEILNSINSSRRLGAYLTPGNALLPMAFPEGSPTHPSYGAGHATVAGACTTILKAWFDEDFVIPNPVVPDSNGTSLVPYTGRFDLTVGGELNKIASNVAIGRNMAGVHWLSDATESLKLGEAVAISILRDQKACYNENFSGFSLTKFDGTTVTV